MAPEVLSRTGNYDYRCDFWSLGVVLFVVLSGTPPFHHEDDFELFEIIKKGKFEFDAPAWANVSAEAKDLIKNLLVVDPRKRFTAKEIKQHPWVTGFTALPPRAMPTTTSLGSAIENIDVNNF